MLKVEPISLRQANPYVTTHHRHHKAARGHKFSVSVVDGNGHIRGVGIAGRPVSRVLDKDGYLEVVRVCTDGDTQRLFDDLRCAQAGWDRARLSGAQDHHLHARVRAGRIAAGRWVA